MQALIQFDLYLAYAPQHMYGKKNQIHHYFHLPCHEIPCIAVIALGLNAFQKCIIFHFLGLINPFYPRRPISVVNVWPGLAWALSVPADGARPSLFCSKNSYKDLVTTSFQ